MTDSTTNFTTDDFFHLLARSGLLNDSLYEAQKVRFLKAQAHPKVIISQLLSENLLTPFQAKQLGERRHRGFFLSEKYKILDFLGQGGMSRVLLCEHLLLQRLVAVKILNKSLDKFPGAAERFLREARASASMDHPNIARVFDVDRTGLGPCIVMEYVDGANLHEIATKGNLLSINRVAHYISQAAIGLQQAHQAGLVHRDVKPANLMLDRSGTIKLLDLGLARFFDPTRSDNLTQQIDSSCIIGTADYIAPEQVMESSSADIRADIYSLGYTMYFLLTRTLPAGEGPAMRKLLWHQTGDPEPIRKLRPEVPEELAAVLDRMIKKKPEERYQTPIEVVEALTQWTATPVADPSDDEMPRTKPASYRLGLCPPPDSSKLAGATSSSQASNKSGSQNSNTGSSALQSKSNADNASVGSGNSASMIGYTNPRDVESFSTDDSTVQAAKTNEVMSASTETASTSGRSFVRGQAESSKVPQGIQRRHQLILLGLIAAAFGVGGLTSQSWTAKTSTSSIPANRVQKNVSMSAGSQPVPEIKSPAAVVPPLPPVSNRVVLRGGGSTLIRPVMQLWSGLYEKQTGVKIEYSAVGSSKGVDGLIANFLDFACTDAFLSDSQIDESGSTILHIPLAMGAVVPAYNVNVIGESSESQALRFTGPLLAQIYLGKVKRWNDPAIVVNNPGRTLPDIPIAVIYRKDGSGTTAIWTDYLSKTNSNWQSQVGVGNNVQWPVGIAAEKNDGMADTISRTVGAIGYLELGSAIANGLSVGQVKNQAGVFVEPTVEGITAAALAAIRGIPADLRYSLNDAPGAASYSIIGTCWAILRVDQTSERGVELVRFLRWATTDGQSNLAGLKFGRLPSELSDRVKLQLDKVVTVK